MWRAFLAISVPVRSVPCHTKSTCWNSTRRALYSRRSSLHALYLDMFSTNNWFHWAPVDGVCVPYPWRRTFPAEHFVEPHFRTQVFTEATVKQIFFLVPTFYIQVLVQLSFQVSSSWNQSSKQHSVQSCTFKQTSRQTHYFKRNFWRNQRSRWSFSQSRPFKKNTRSKLFKEDFVTYTSSQVELFADPTIHIEVITNSHFQVDSSQSEPFKQNSSRIHQFEWITLQNQTFLWTYFHRAEVTGGTMHKTIWLSKSLTDPTFETELFTEPTFTAELFPNQTFQVKRLTE